MKVPVRIKLTAHDTKSIASFEHSIGNNASIMEGYAVTGTSDYLLIVSVIDIKELEIVHRNILTRLPGVMSIKVDIPLRQIDL